MKFSEAVAQTCAWLQREGRVSYRALKLEFDLDDDVIEALKDELIDAKRIAADGCGDSSEFNVPGSKCSPAPHP